jgi:hypothetical protein
MLGSQSNIYFLLELFWADELRDEISTTRLTETSWRGFFEKNSENPFIPQKWLNRKTNGTIRKCSSRTFQ